MNTETKYSTATSQQFMCAINPDTSSTELIKLTCEQALKNDIPWIAVYVENKQNLSEKNKQILSENFKLVEELGGEVVTTQDINVKSALIRIAKEKNVTRIITKKQINSGFLQNIFLRNNLSDVITKSDDIDILIMGSAEKIPQNTLSNISTAFKYTWWQYLAALIVITLTGGMAFLLEPSIGYQVVPLIFLLVLSLLPLFNFGTGSMLFSALLMSLGWNFFFTQPLYTLHISDPEDVMMFFVFFIVALVSGFLSSKVRTQQKFLLQREERTAALYNLTKDLYSAASMDEISDIAINKTADTFDSQIALIYPESKRTLQLRPHRLSFFIPQSIDWEAAQWCYVHNKISGKFTKEISNTEASYYPLKSKSSTHGVIGVKHNSKKAFTPEQEIYFESFVGQITSAIEREYLNDIAKQILVSEESEKLYKTLFNSISHELKTPITTIIGASTSFDDDNIADNKEARNNLGKEIGKAAARLNRLVENLLDMTRLESGKLKIKLEWNDINDLISNILQRIKSEEITHKILSNINMETNPFRFDYGLLEQSLLNVLYNCINYTPVNTVIKINVNQFDDTCSIEISDTGPGFPNESVNKLFDKFYRVPGSKTGGTGLGLSIAKGFIEAHNGTIIAENKPDGGAIFKINIPIIK